MATHPPHPCAEGHQELKLMSNVTSLLDNGTVMLCNRCGNTMSFEDAVRNDERMKLMRGIQVKVGYCSGPDDSLGQALVEMIRKAVKGSPMSVLIDRLKAAIDTDEQIARNLADGLPWRADHGKVFSPTEFIAEARNPNHAWHIALHDPARVLRQVAAHRKILEEHKPSTVRGGWERDETICGTCSYDGGLDDYSFPCPTLTALAEAYGIEVQP